MIDEIAKFKVQPKGFATKAIHVGQDPDQWNSRAVIPPIVTSTTFKQEAPAKHSVIYSVLKENNYFWQGNCEEEVVEKRSKYFVRHFVPVYVYEKNRIN